LYCAMVLPVGSPLICEAMNTRCRTNFEPTIVEVANASLLATSSICEPAIPVFPCLAYDGGGADEATSPGGNQMSSMPTPAPTLTRTKPARLTSIQSMRGIAALLVLTSHAAGIAVLSGTPSGWFTPRDLFNFDKFGAVGVDLFFIISGFVMAYAAAPKAGRKAAGNFLLMRWVRVAPPYLLASLIMIPIVIFQGRPPSGMGIFNTIAFVPWLDTATYSVPPLNVGWTLSFEISFYLLVAVMVAVGWSHRMLWLAGVMVAMVAVGLVFTDAPLIVRWFTNPMFLELALGIIAYAVWKRGVLDRRKWPWAAAGVAGAALLIPQVISGDNPMATMENIVDGSMSLQRVMLWGLPAFLIFVAALAFDRARSGCFASLSAKLGDASYSIYLIHIPAIVCATFVLRRLPFTIAPDAVFLMFIAVGLAAGALFYRYVERPMTSYLQHRLRTK
jgi:exopolysaccharide production protein ExoZ